MSKAVEKWTEIIEKVNSIAMRERVILCAAVVVGFSIALVTFVIEPLQEAQKEYEEQLSALQLETQESQTSLRFSV